MLLVVMMMFSSIVRLLLCVPVLSLVQSLFLLQMSSPKPCATSAAKALPRFQYSQIDPKPSKPNPKPLTYLLAFPATTREPVTSSRLKYILETSPKLLKQSATNGGLPQFGVPFCEVPIPRIIICVGLY